MVLGTTTLAHDVNKDLCLQHGGILPEPLSQEENEFLNSLGSDMFVLGMSDKGTEDSWVWDSNGTPVVYTNWYGSEPAGGTRENCAVMFRNYESGGAFWGDLPCSSSTYMESKKKSLICQKRSEGRPQCLIHFECYVNKI